MKNILILAAISILTGCGVDSGLFGSSTSTSSASSSSGGDGGMGGSGGTGSTTTTCTPQVTCESIGAECGVIQDDGCGNTIDCVNTCAAPFVCGGGNSQYQCGCSPKTCEELGKDCGSVDDGCGHSIECGMCDPNKFQTICGGWKVTDGGLLAPQPNVCGGGCGRDTSPGGGIVCANIPGHTVQWNCDSNSLPVTPIPPSSDCIYISSVKSWCCTE